MIKKTLFLAVAAGIIGLLCTSSKAAPVSGSDPVEGTSHWALAGEYDFIYGRDLESSDITNGEITQSNAAYGKLSIRPAEFLTLYGKAGVTNFRTDMNMTNGKALKEEFETGFYTGGGGKFIYGLGSRLKLVFDGQYNWWNCNIEEVDYGGVSATSVSGDVTAWEYQAAGLLCFIIDWQKVIHPIQGEYPILTPYLGAKYAHLEIESDVKASAASFSVTAPEKRENDNNFGVVLGLDVSFLSPSRFRLNIEGRFIDETAISGYLNYNF